ncbi:MAG: nucleoside-triphosphatase, partial [Candidatus Methylomirabilis sp.]
MSHPCWQRGQDQGPDREGGGPKPSVPQALLLTGPSGSGKTILLQQVVTQLGSRAGEFYTTELLAQGRRVGFEIVRLAGERGRLAHVQCASPYRVGRYGVDLDALERVGVFALRRTISTGRLVVVDEIGRMELGSAAFRDTVLEALAGGAWLLGTILQPAHPWADDLKRDRRVLVLRVTRSAWDAVRRDVLTWVGTLPGLEPGSAEAK